MQLRNVVSLIFDKSTNTIAETSLGKNSGAILEAQPSIQLKRPNIKSQYC